METFTALVDPARIASLPWHVGIPGMLLIAVLAFSAVKAALTLKPIRACTRLVMAFAIAVILTRGGEAIAAFLAALPFHSPRISLTIGVNARPTALVFSASRCTPSIGVVRATVPASKKAQPCSSARSE